MYRGSPTYTKITKTVSTTTVFGLCTCMWGIFALVGDPLQSHQHEFHIARFFPSPKMRVSTSKSDCSVKTWTGLKDTKTKLEKVNMPSVEFMNFTLSETDTLARVKLILPPCFDENKKSEYPLIVDV